MAREIPQAHHANGCSVLTVLTVLAISYAWIEARELDQRRNLLMENH